MDDTFAYWNSFFRSFICCFFFLSLFLFIVSTIDSSGVFRVIENIFILSAYEKFSLVTRSVGTRAEK